MLISRVLPIMSIYRLPHGQYAYSGHVINMPQDITTFVNSLPRTPSSLDVLIVQREGAAASHKDFNVRRSVVLSALQWLVANNIFYREVTIDNLALAHLPIDGNLTPTLSTVNISSGEDVDTNPSQDVDNSDYLANSFIPLPLQGVTEQEAIQRSVDGSGPVRWPSTSGNAINEFTTEGYMSCAFPSLFPTGAADFISPRQRSVTIGGYFRHLMLYHDQRFAKHPRFRYAYFNGLSSKFYNVLILIFITFIGTLP